MRSWLLFGIWLIFLACCHGDSLSQYLWKQTENQQQEALTTKYILGLVNKNLDPTSFGVYNVQDVIYCYHSKQVIGIAMARTTDTELKQLFDHLYKSYTAYTEEIMDAWHIEDPKGITLGPSCSNYVNHLYDVANNMDPIYLVPAMTPCAKLWPWLGKQLNASSGNFGVYTNWVKVSLDPDSHGYEKYDAMIDSAENRKLINRSLALDVYSKSMDGEVAFFSLDAYPTFVSQQSDQLRTEL